VQSSLKSAHLDVQKYKIAIKTPKNVKRPAGGVLVNHFIAL
jgi:hypothetical protein